MTSDKIKGFFGPLDRHQTKDAVRYGAGRLTVAEVANAVTEDMTADQMLELVTYVVGFAAELETGGAA
jgi:hypothetical protein